MIPFLHLFGQEPEVTEAADHFFLIVAVSMIPAIGSMALKKTRRRDEPSWPAFWIMLGSVGLNVLLNWILILGKMGRSRDGTRGRRPRYPARADRGLVALIVWCRRSPAMREWIPHHWIKRPHGPSIRSLVKVGLPASLQCSPR